MQTGLSVPTFSTSFSWFYVILHPNSSSTCQFRDIRPIPGRVMFFKSHWFCQNFVFEGGIPDKAIRHLSKLCSIIFYLRESSNESNTYINEGGLILLAKKASERFVDHSNIES